MRPTERTDTQNGPTELATPTSIVCEEIGAKKQFSCALESCSQVSRASDLRATSAHKLAHKTLSSFVVALNETSRQQSELQYVVRVATQPLEQSSAHALSECSQSIWLPELIERHTRASERVRFCRTSWRKLLVFVLCVA